MYGKGLTVHCTIASLFLRMYVRSLYCVPKHGSCHGISRWMQDFSAMKLPSSGTRHLGQPVAPGLFNIGYFTETRGQRHAPAALPAGKESPLGLPIAQVQHYRRLLNRNILVLGCDRNPHLVDYSDGHAGHESPSVSAYVQLEERKASFQLRPSSCACLPTFDLFNRLTCSKLPCTQSSLPVSPEQHLPQSQGMLFAHCLVSCIYLLGIVISDQHRIGVLW